MWIVSDKAMNELLDGDFALVKMIYDNDNNKPKRYMYFFQDKYLTYAGFCKFWRTKLGKVIKLISYIDNNGLLGKLIKKVSGIRE